MSVRCHSWQQCLESAEYELLIVNFLHDDEVKLNSSYLTFTLDGFFKTTVLTLTSEHFHFRKKSFFFSFFKTYFQNLLMLKNFISALKNFLNFSIISNIFLRRVKSFENQSFWMLWCGGRDIICSCYKIRNSPPKWWKSYVQQI